MRIVELRNIAKNQYGNRIFALLGYENPTGSIKDVTVEGMLQGYQKSGKLNNETTIIEATSGNTGISLAYFQNKYSYKCIIVMPLSMSHERRMMIQRYGGELILVDGGMKECNEKAKELVKTIKNSFIFSQFDNLDNRLAHYKITGPLIYDSIKEIDYLFAGIGTGGTISGSSKFLKEKIPLLKCVGVEPLESPLLTKGYASSHLIQGIGANFIPNNLDRAIVDEYIDVSGEASIDMAKRIKKEENLDVGISSGAALLGALNYIQEHNIKDKNILVIFPDKGDRYKW